MANRTILQMVCPSDWDGAQMAEDGPIGLRMIEFNRSRWEASDQLSSLFIPDGGQLIIRREGRRIFIER